MKRKTMTYRLYFQDASFQTRTLFLFFSLSFSLSFLSIHCFTFCLLFFYYFIIGKCRSRVTVTTKQKKKNQSVSLFCPLYTPFFPNYILECAHSMLIQNGAMLQCTLWAHVGQLFCQDLIK
jgi:Ca2+/Na+ antiporter